MALPNPRPPFVVPDPPILSEEQQAELPFAALAMVEATGDIEIPPRIVRGVEAIRLRIVARLKFFKGEWFLDTRQGMPYFTSIFVKNPELALVESIFRRAILSTPGVKTIVRMAIKLDTGSRTLTINPLEIQLSGGEVFRAQPGDFIIDIL